MDDPRGHLGHHRPKRGRGVADRAERAPGWIARSYQRDIAADELAVDAVMRQICERAQELTHADSRDRPHPGMAISSRFPRRHGLLGRQGRCPITPWKARFPVGGTRTTSRRSSGRRSGRPSGGRPCSRAGDALGRRRPTPTSRRVCRAADRRSHGDPTSSRRDLKTLELLSVLLSSALSHAAEFESKRQQFDALARFQTMYQEAAIGITMVSPEGRSIAANPAFEEMFGYIGRRTDHDDPARLHASGRHRRERDRLRGHDGRAPRFVSAREAVPPQGRPGRVGAGRVRAPSGR